MRVLVAEKIGESGIELLQRAGLEVEIGTSWDRAELERRIADFDGILIRSATQVDADLLAKADRLRVVARAGVGVDNVDVDAATRRGVLVANAPQSNVITAAEHTMALLLALARNVPQAHASLIGGAWDRARFSGVELHEKTLGVIGFGRIGQLVAHRARGFGMRVIAFDAYLAAERFRELGVERAADPDQVYAVADFVTVHLPKTKETEGWLNAAAFAKMKDGVRILNVARGPLVVDADLQAALDSGKVAGAALDVFRTEPVTDHPLFGYPNVIVTPHLGASTAEATDRAGYQAAEQAVAGLTGGSVTSAVNLPSIAPDDLEAVGPFLGLAYLPGVPRSRSMTSTRSCSPTSVASRLPSGASRTRTTSPTSFASACAAATRRPAWSARSWAGVTGRTCSRPGAHDSTCNSRNTSPFSATAISRACSDASARHSATPA